MKKFLIAASALSALLAFAGSASAADPIVDDPAYDWSGFYIGATAGYGWGEARTTDSNGISSGDFDIDGFIGGATAGGNWQTGNLVFGVEGDISFSDISGSVIGDCGVDGCSTDIDWLGTLRARGGFAFDNLLIFAAGGLAVGDVNATCCTALAPDNENSETLYGWTIGGGLEWAVTEAISVKAEYLFVDLGHVDIPTPAPTEADVDETHIVRAGINFHF